MSGAASPSEPRPDWTGYSEVPERERAGWLDACRELTGATLEGLDVGREICAIASQGLGETVLLRDGGRLVGLAACHCGPGTEAGDAACYIKFGAVRPGPHAAQTFDRLLYACAALAVTRGLSHLVGGVNTARHGAYRQMIARGFRILAQGVAMDRPNEPGYNRPDVYLIDDWR
jgi:hypothetical protein